METRFEALSEEKQERILNAAMKEFAAMGYDKASTNAIVKEAGIAKGLLFHYFGSKKQLFMYLYDYAIGLFVKEIQEKIDYGQREFFARMNSAQIVKMEIIGNHPDIMDFLKSAYLEQAPAVRRDLDERNRDLLQISLAMVFENIDTSSFRGDVDPYKIINTVVWAIEGFADGYMNTVKNSDPVDYKKMFDETENYVNFLKTCFTK